MCMLVVVLSLCYFRGHDIWNESFFFFFLNIVQIYLILYILHTCINEYKMNLY